MAEKEVVATETPVEETVSKADYDALVKEYQRLAAAFNKALGVIANDYADKVAKQIFDEVDKAAK